MKFNKIKILLVALIILLGVMVTTEVKAVVGLRTFSWPDNYEVTGDTPQEPGGDGTGYVAHLYNGNWTFCIVHGSYYRADYKGEFREGAVEGPYCTVDNKEPTVGAEWERFSLEYVYAGGISASQNQDVAYILAFSPNKYDRETQVAIWSTALNTGREEVGGTLGKEAAAFKTFYNTIHDTNGKDIFQSKVYDQTTNVKVAVNADDSYTVGPFRVSFPNGHYNGKNKFSWITSLTGVTDVGNVPVEIYLASGQLVSMADIGQNGTVSLNGQDFYIKFKNANATRVSISMSFGYLESCYAKMSRYEGTQYGYHWIRKDLGECIYPTYYPGTDLYPHTTFKAHDHGYVHGTGIGEYDGWIHGSGIGEHDGWKDDSNNDGYSDIACNGYRPLGTRPCGGTAYNDGSYTENSSGKQYPYLCSSCGQTAAVLPVLKPSTPCGLPVTNYVANACTYPNACTHPNACTEKIKGTMYVWEMRKYSKGPSQVVLHVEPITVSGSKAYASTSYGTASTTLASGGIDLTMNISGTVFLDKDAGKVNEGNNVLDSGEQLPGVEVRLFNSSGVQLGIKLTDINGYYEFTGLNALGKYYVRFTYNGMLYTNVAYGTSANSSKATETAQGQTSNRTNFNNKFAQIGSYPANYTTTDCITGAKITNKTFLQEDIASLFKEVTKEIVNNGGNEKAAYQAIINKYKSDADIKQKVQFIADNRIHAYTVNNYPLQDQFVINAYNQVLAGVGYVGIYNTSTHSQVNVNLGIKARPTFDMALYKDVQKAVISINGRTETYNYDSRKGSANGFSVGIRESDYLNGLRGAYTSGSQFANNKQTRDIETDTYNLNMRTEDITNGTQGILNGEGATKYALADNETLKVHITYKIALRNQSTMKGAVTEIVDYYDTNYTFVQAYIGNANGEKTGTVKKYDTSMYGNEYKSTKNSYNTIYLRPTETILSTEQEQYIYVEFELNNASSLLTQKLVTDKDQLNVLNIAEINGYKTEAGLIDIDSNPGNLNISNIAVLTQENIVNYPNIKSMYEDDTSRAPALIYKLYDSRTLEGTVFEDSTGKTNKVYTNEVREGNGQLDGEDKPIAGVQVQLIEVKGNTGTIRAIAETDANGVYKFTGFLPGEYIIRYTYGKDDKTAMTTSSTWYKGLNAKSYNGQEYQSTIYTAKTGDYWYTEQNALNDAKDNTSRVKEVINYSRTENGTAIVNHKAEVFNAYVNPQASHITKEINRQLANELAEKTYRYADTARMIIELEYATKETTGTKAHEHKITGVDFGIVERPKSELTIDQDVKHIKVTATDGTVLFDTETGTNNLQWSAKGDISKYDTNELINIIMDDELISGAKLEITYNITVTNNSEKDGDTTTIAKNILNYVSNNLNFDVEDNKDANGRALWEVVAKDKVQTNDVKTYVNSVVDLSTQSIILKATDKNPLVTTNLKPGQQVTTTLKLKKVLSAESATDDLRYTNLAEIVEIDNTVGRYDKGAIPGNQQINEAPQEHDSTGIKNGLNMDGTVIVTPPTGSQYIYYVIGITSAIILLAGIYFIRKFVVKKK